MSSTTTTTAQASITEQDQRRALKSALDAQLELKSALEKASIPNDQLVKIQSDPKDQLSSLDESNETLNKHLDLHKRMLSTLHNFHFHLKSKVNADREEYVKSQVRNEIARQVEEEVKRQIANFLPVSLDDQIREARERLRKMQMALQNSQARVKNGEIGMSDWNEPLKAIGREDGEKSQLYPADLGTLYHYDAATIQALLRHYDLEVDSGEEYKRHNFTRFAQFIGVRVEGEVYI
ncbi:hypothetical protein APHAL10511_004807 [Amanita phalloides]|nr:hypothetical protein APHAL10511_004807 [Amanita phalloides]